jgi:hypothetical protein
MTDDELIARFEDCSLEPFRHFDHVRVAWVYLQRGALLDALTRMSDGLRRFAASHGVPERYHETITLAFVLLIADRVARAAPGHSFEEFTATNADLFDWQQGSIRPYYRAETLASDLARRHFLFPDASEGQSARA